MHHAQELSAQVKETSPILDRPFIYLTGDVWSQVWKREWKQKTFSMPNNGINGDAYQACQQILHTTWKPKPHLRSEIDRLHKELRLSPDSYATLHVRRGDKSRGAELVEVKRDAEMAKTIDPAIDCHLIVTDDYRVIRELEMFLPGKRLVTLCDPQQHRHEHGALNQTQGELRKRETERPLAELTLARAGRFFVGNYLSNIARLVTRLRGRETTYGVDGPYTVYY